MSTMAHRVVINGIGPVTSIGNGAAAFWRSLLDREFSAFPIPAEFERSYSFHSRWYVPLKMVSLADHGMRFTFENAMQHEDRMAVTGAKLALEDAGFPLEISERGMRVEGLNRCSVLIGTGLGGLESAFQSYCSHRFSRDQLKDAAFPETSKFNRMVIPATMPNSPAAWVSICFGIHGQCTTINASCASGTIAIGEAFRRIRDGYDDVVLCGGVECLKDSSGAIMRGFDLLGALTRSGDGIPRPFSKSRSGFLFSEGGASMLVLESHSHAQSRNARMCAEILDYRCCSDAANIIQIEKEGRQIIRMLGEISDGHKIDYLNAHGTGTETNDSVETIAIQQVFGDAGRQPFISSTKGIIGHTLGASGAISAAATALSIAQDAVHGNLTDDPIDNLNLPISSLKATIRRALTVSYGFGGHNAALLLGKVG
jgi:3-oxoacyl-[acyl-carrier-protein] synthase II